MYSVIIVKIGTSLDNELNNYPFPYMISEMYKPNNYRVIDNVDSFQDPIEGINFYCSNYFNDSLIIDRNLIDQNKFGNFSSTYGLAYITSSQEFSQDNLNLKKINNFSRYLIKKKKLPRATSNNKVIFKKTWITFFMFI